MSDQTGDQRRPRRSSKRPQSVSKAADARPERSRDRLGKLMEQHRVTLLGVLVVTGFLGIVGLGVCGYAWLKDPRSLTLLIIGGFVILLAVILFGINILNVGCSVEIRKKGIRYTQRGARTEMLWNEIVDVSVDRLDNTSMGPVTVRRRSDDASSPSGLLTKTEWTVVITADDGRQIRLTPTFLRVVSDPKSLISNLKLRSGT
jgi:hypothetical protein